MTVNPEAVDDTTDGPRPPTTAMAKTSAGGVWTGRESGAGFISGTRLWRREHRVGSLGGQGRGGEGREKERGHEAPSRSGSGSPNPEVVGWGPSPPTKLYWDAECHYG